MKTGFYAYLWLREDGTPYYAGKGRDNRAFRHSMPPHPPKDKSRIIVFHRSSEEDAFATEAELVVNWGRKDLGTGCLLNRSDGGIGSASGFKHSAEARAKKSAQMMGNKNPLGCHRDNHGEKNPKAKLTIQKAKEIRDLYASGNYIQKDLAEKFGVNQQSISHVVSGATWQ